MVFDELELRDQQVIVLFFGVWHFNTSTESSLHNVLSLWCSFIFHDILWAGCGVSSAVYSLTEIVKSDQISHQGQGLSPQATVFAPEDHYIFNGKPIVFPVLEVTFNF